MKKIILALLVFTSSCFALPNPAAVNCINKGFRYLMLNNTAICMFPDNSYCEEWAYFRGECKPGQNFPVTKGGTQQSGS